MLGVCGGDGTVNAAAEVALRHGLPLAVLPGGTLNHFAYDLASRTPGTCAGPWRAVRAYGWTWPVRLRRAAWDLPEHLQPGRVPELVNERERWSPRIGGWPAGVLAAVRVLRADRHPLEAEVRGRRRPLWMLFAGNGTYHRRGIASGRRLDLADGQLDVRVVHGGRRPALRLLSAALAGR